MSRLVRIDHFEYPRKKRIQNGIAYSKSNQLDLSAKQISSISGRANCFNDLHTNLSSASCLNQYLPVQDLLDIILDYTKPKNLYYYENDRINIFDLDSGIVKDYLNVGVDIIQINIYQNKLIVKFGQSEIGYYDILGGSKLIPLFQASRAEYFNGKYYYYRNKKIYCYDFNTMTESDTGIIDNNHIIKVTEKYIVLLVDSSYFNVYSSINYTLIISKPLSDMMFLNIFEDSFYFATDTLLKIFDIKLDNPINIIPLNHFIYGGYMVDNQLFILGKNLEQYDQKSSKLVPFGYEVIQLFETSYHSACIKDHTNLIDLKSKQIYQIPLFSGPYFVDH